MFKTKPSIVTCAVLLSLGLTACGGSSSNAPTNSAPTDITLSKAAVDENAVAAVIGSLSTTDSDANDAHTYSVTDKRFAIKNGSLALAADTSLNFEDSEKVTLSVKSTDKGGKSMTKEFTITVNDLVDTYKFASKVKDDKSSVSYGGQIARQILLVQLTNYIDTGLATDYKNNKFQSKQDVIDKLMSLYAGSADDWEESQSDTPINFGLDLPTTQTTISQISSSHKNLQGKIAGKDATGQTANWATDLVGWNDKGSVTPDGLVQAYFSMIAQNVQDALDSTPRKDINGKNITKFYITKNGLDLKQLTQKFLLGAVNFSQATDDYLDNDLDGKGLNANNISGDKDGAKDYTALEHAFDEGFGYFGAARDYNDYTDLEIRAKAGREGWKKGYHDTNGDGKIDLLSEFNFGNSTNAAKRDVGATVATDFTKDIFDAFLAGRIIINDNVGGEFTAEQKTTLAKQSQVAIQVWEKAISSTIIHYINEVINDDLAALGTDDFNYSDLAKHWSEMKGFALNLQFNPSSPVTAEQFAKIHELIGMEPVLMASEVTAYSTKLKQARDILQTAYGFNSDNVKNW